MSKRVIKITNYKPDVCNGTKIIHHVIDELEQARLQSGMSKKEFAEYFDSLKPKSDTKLDMSGLMLYGTKGEISGENPFK